MPSPDLTQSTRRQFISRSAGAVGATTLLPTVAIAANTPAGADASDVYGAFPSVDPEMLRQTVAFSHANIDGLKELIEKQPELAKASIDWGFGDWESALGAASHMGRRDIAELLMANGARPTHFTFAMLGQADVVRGFVEANPGIQRHRGPHGFTLAHHARAGGEAAKGTLEYLESLGDADIGYTNEPLSDDEKAMLVGFYRFGSGDDDRFEALVNQRGMFQFKRVTQRFGRAMFHQGDLEFHPTGAEHTRITFTRDGDSVSKLTLKMAGQVIEAARE